MKTLHLTKYLLILTISILGTSSTFGQKQDSLATQFFKPKAPMKSSKDEISILKRDIQEIQGELDYIRSQQKEYDDLTLPQIREEIQRIINIPEKVSQISLLNGTIVYGEILKETVDEMLVRTPIGLLSIQKDNVKTISDFSTMKPEIEIVGEPIETKSSGKITYKGYILNKGLRRADFVRVIFKLHDESTKVITQDSAFVFNKPIELLSGVRLKSSINPGEKLPFTVEVPLPKGVVSSNVSYHTTRVEFEIFE